MTYTLWSRGRLLGQTELAYRQAMPGLRAGDFIPSELGERLMPIMDGLSPALFALYDVEKKVLLANPTERRIDGWPVSVRATTEFADVMSIADELESLELELRDPSGAVVDAEHIWIQDTERVIAFGEAASDHLDDEGLTDEMRAAIEHDAAELLAYYESLDDDRNPWEADCETPWQARRDDDNEGDDSEEGQFPRYQIFVNLAGYEPFDSSQSPID